MMLRLTHQDVLRLALVVVALLLLVVVWSSGFLDTLLHAESLEEEGWPTGLFFVGVFMLLGTIGVPPALLILSVSAGYNFWPALAISFLGGLGAALFGFLFGRYVARDYIDRHIPPKVRHFEARLEEHGFSTVLILRFLFFLFPPVNWLLGISHIRLRTFAGATLLGALPGIVAITGTGRGLMGLLLERPALLLPVGLVAIAGIIIWWHFILHLPLKRAMRERGAGNQE